jgi:DHA2 family multidrug resistance protein-like MFS transporter
VFSLGLAPVFTLATDLVVGTAPPERAGAAAAISETSSEFGGALGIALLGSAATAVYRREMADTIPTGLSPVDAESARSTLGAAVALGEQLSGPMGAELIVAARDAFAQAMELAALISAAIALVTALGVAVVLRRVEPGGHDDGEEPEPVRLREEGQQAADAFAGS